MNRQDHDLKVCMTIAGLDPSGGAGVIADIKTFSAFGCFATAVITSLTFQNTTGVFGSVHQSAEAVRGQMEPVVRDFEVAALKTGMLPTVETIEETANLIVESGIPYVVVDPVVRSTSGFDLIGEDALRSLVAKLFPLATLITPNIPEAERITGMTINNEGDIETAAERMRSAGAKAILIKGGHRPVEHSGTGSRTARDYLFMDREMKQFDAQYLDTSATHGTGCTLSAAITAGLALDKPMAEAVSDAKMFVTEAIRTAPGLGKGHSPINIIRR